MSYTNNIFFIFLISISSLSLAMDPPMLPPVDRTYPLDFKPMPFANDPKDDDENMIIPHLISAKETNNETFEGMDVRDLQIVLEKASYKARAIVDHLKGPALDPTLRSLFLIGDHGTGKTILAKAIAYEVITKTQWAYEYKNSREFMGKHRNETGVRLRGYLNKITQSQQPTLLILDQLNMILDHPNSESDDTAFANSLICSLLDGQRRNENFFFIGIMKRSYAVCERLKNRMGGSSLFTKKPHYPQLKRIIFTSKCINESTQFHPEVTNDWLEKFLEQAPNIQGRHFRGLALQIHEQLQKEDVCANEEALITQENLETALCSYLRTQKEKRHIDLYESYRDRQERIHQEEMKTKIITQIATSEEHAQQLQELSFEQLGKLIGLPLI